MGSFPYENTTMESTASLLKLAATVVIFYIPFQIFLRYRRLWSIPGPYIACFTDLWRAYAQNFSVFADTLLELHERYGPLVRIGPNTVSVGDPAAIAIIYTNRGEFKKVRALQKIAPSYRLASDF